MQQQCRYSIISSARAIRVSGTARPSALAVLRLTPSPYRMTFLVRADTFCDLWKRLYGADLIIRPADLNEHRFKFQQCRDHIGLTISLHFAARRCSDLSFPDNPTRFFDEHLLFALDPAPIVPAHGAVARDDAMARDRWIVIRAHHRADGSRSFGIARFRRDFFVGHRLPFRDFPNDRANFFGECFHILSVPECVGLAIFCPPPATPAANAAALRQWHRWLLPDDMPIHRLALRTRFLEQSNMPDARSVEVVRDNKQFTFALAGLPGLLHVACKHFNLRCGAQVRRWNGRLNGRSGARSPDLSAFDPTRKRNWGCGSK